VPGGTRVMSSTDLVVERCRDAGLTSLLGDVAVEYCTSVRRPRITSLEERGAPAGQLLGPFGHVALDVREPTALDGVDEALGLDAPDRLDSCPRARPTRMASAARWMATRRTPSRVRTSADPSPERPARPLACS